ncbi:hypothetical protein L3V82_13080 [Thiotrichales bacterium 19S3-7]|nr:hypothetical protein [Thiotrichales bacterium 19S3-7]MCF6803104.1 hypothetical protein [Thiotrichales bacterium 19S3-11]
MEIWLDSADTQSVIHFENIGLISGITTNPKILSGTIKPPLETLQSLLEASSKPICAQILAQNAREIIVQAKELQNISKRIIVKIPANEQGYLAMKELVDEGIPVLSTSVFTASQVLISCKLNVDYIAPYINHIKLINLNWEQEIKKMVMVVNSINCKSKLMMASIKSIEDIYYSIAVGAKSITVPGNILEQLLDTPEEMSEVLDEFQSAWNTVKEDLIFANE